MYNLRPPFQNIYEIGRSKFCALRPKWCIIAGASGTYSVCVCTYHQNAKLMIDGVKWNGDYKSLLEVLVCNVENYDYMMDNKLCSVPTYRRSA